MYNYFNVAYHLWKMNRRVFWRPEELRKYQNMRLREIMRYAYENVPYYHRKLRDLQLQPTDIRNAEDLRKLPILTKKDVRENIFSMISDKCNVESLRVLSTSGSTGYPTFTYVSRGEDEFRKAKHLRANIAIGQKPRDRWIVVAAPLHFSETSRLQRFLGIYSATPLSVFENPERQVSILRHLKPDILDGYSSSLYLLAKEFEKDGEGSLSLKFVIGGADLIDSYSRNSVEKSFGVPFYDQYACSELERLAWQCEKKDMYHIDVDSLIMEFVDKRGEGVSPMERGEIVCTSLFNRAMPLVRYTVGDIGVPSDERECECGRTFPLMKVMEGRRDSIIQLPYNRFLAPLAIGDCMVEFKHFGCIDQYVVVQKKVNFLKFLIKTKSKGREDSEVIKAELLRHIRQVLKIDENDVSIEIDLVDEIPLDKSGKLRKVISEI